MPRVRWHFLYFLPDPHQHSSKCFRARNAFWTNGSFSSTSTTLNGEVGRFTIFSLETARSWPNGETFWRAYRGYQVAGWSSVVNRLCPRAPAARPIKVQNASYGLFQRSALGRFRPRRHVDPRLIADHGLPQRAGDSARSWMRTLLRPSSTGKSGISQGSRPGPRNFLARNVYASASPVSRPIWS